MGYIYDWDYDRHSRRGRRQHRNKKPRWLSLFCGVIVALLVVTFTIFLIQDSDVLSGELIAVYNSLGQQGVASSKINFKKDVKYINQTVNEDGQIVLAIGGDNSGDTVTPADGNNEDTGGTTTGGNDDGSGRIPDLNGTNYTKEQVLEDISKGKYTKEDVDYITALTKEAGGYRANLAVAAVVINRAKLGKTSIKSVVTAPGQFQGYEAGAVGGWTVDKDLFNASIALLRGDEKSPIGEARYFFGRVNGYDLWAETGAGQVTNLGGNVFYEKYGLVHNKKGNNTPSNGHCIYNHTLGKWILGDGEYKRY